MDQKQSKYPRALLLGSDSESVSQPNLFGQQALHQVFPELAQNDFNSSEDFNYELNNEINSNQGRQMPLEAVAEWDKQREDYRRSYRGSKGKYGRKQRNQRGGMSKEDREIQEMADVIAFKKYTVEGFVNKEKKDKQFKTTIDGVQVVFPFEPYNIQLRYMQRVMQCVTKGQNGLLQSPTGTGKTLCLLCSVLSWLASQKSQNRHRRLIYLSRTHTQLQQAIKELKTTCFQPTMVHVGSRDHACIKPELQKLKGRQKMQACSKAVKLKLKYTNRRQAGQQDEIDDHEKEKQKSAMCRYYLDRVDTIDIGRTYFPNKVMDLQQMRPQGQKLSFCPYYYPFHMQKYIDVFFMPYNYILDAALLPRYKDIIAGSVLVFDQAHNVAEASCQGRSAEMFLANIKGAELELNKIVFPGKKSKGLELLARDNMTLINQLVHFLTDLTATIEECLKAIPFEDAPKEHQKLYKGQKAKTAIKMTQYRMTATALYELFAGKLQNPSLFLNEPLKAKEKILNLSKASIITCMMMQDLIQKLKETQDGIFHNLQKVGGFTRKVMSLLQASIDSKNDWFNTQLNHFRLLFQVEMSDTNIGQFDSYRVELRCLVPWLTFDQIQACSPRSILFTSGTMAPLDSWESDLRIKAPVRLINKHVVSNDQIQLNLVCKNNKNNSFNFSYESMKNNSQNAYRQLAFSISQLQKKIPNGILIVCPNFRTLKELSFVLNSSEIKKKLKKTLIFEQRGTQRYVQQFKKQSERGAILICVCRGRASQGIDFPDHHCRAVIMVGIPFPNYKDPYLVQKQQHFKMLQKQARFNKEIPQVSWQSWYKNGTMRAVNQALGRVIRHIKDYGMLFLFDQRYEQTTLLMKISGWARESLVVWSSWEERRIKDVDLFYRENIGRFPQSEKMWAEERENKVSNMKKSREQSVKKKLNQVMGSVVQKKKQKNDKEEKKLGQSNLLSFLFKK